MSSPLSSPARSTPTAGPGPAASPEIHAIAPVVARRSPRRAGPASGADPTAPAGLGGSAPARAGLGGVEQRLREALDAPDPAALLPARAGLGGVEQRLREALDAPDPAALLPARAIALAPCKRVRAAIALAAAAAVDLPAGPAEQLAAAIELVHAFSLVHDDLEDRAALRRGLPAVHVVEGDAIAINSGDALHALAWSALLAIEAPPPAPTAARRALELARALGAALARMVAGQARDLAWTRDRRVDLTIGDYLAMVRGKTGALLGFSAAGPAVLVGHPAAPTLRAAGESLGIALQILDDVAAVRGDAAALGKPVGPGASGAGSAPALLAGPRDDGTAAAVRLAHRYAAHARARIARAAVPAPAGLAAVLEAALAQLLDRSGARTSAR
jgi:geranylgeranyl pyrophosphate synthase